MVHSATGYSKKQDENRYLILDSTDKFEKIWSRVKSEIRKTNGEKEFFYKKDYSKIKVRTDDDLPLNEALKFPTLTIRFRLVFPEGKKLYPTLYLNECLYKV